ncbi:MAG: DNA internalization-related competence protein ComEC/Rec2 [Oribacterium sp.]|nr:DNA internalization-related competence protein ComEC/Rec2 [Oribacterium sp.]
MNVKRPLLSAAAVFVLGECVIARETGLFLNVTSGILLAIFLLCGYKAGKLRKRAMAFLLFVSLFAGVRYKITQHRNDVNKARMEAFSDLNIRLRGEVERVVAGADATRITMKDCRMSSAYGSVEELPKIKTEVMRSRYDQPVGRILVYMDSTPEEMPLPGQIIDCYGKTTALSPATNEGEFDFLLYYRTVSVSGMIFGNRIEFASKDTYPLAGFLENLRRKTGHILDVLGSEEDAGIYRAILAGDKTEMSEDIRNLYQRSGISHILAVSGLHLSIIGMGVFRLLRRRFSKTASGIVAAVLVLMYGFFTGSSGSALRAVIMLLCRFLALAVGRQYDMMSAMALACILLLLHEPYMLFGAGFQLSFMAVLSLGIYSTLQKSSKAASKEQKFLENLVRSFLDGLAGSAFLQLMTLPVILFHFFRVPLYGILLNLIVLPLMNYVVYSGLFAVLVYRLCIPFAFVLFGSGHYFLLLFTALSEWIGTLPYASILIGRPSMPVCMIYYAILAALISTTKWIGKENIQKKKNVGLSKNAESLRNAALSKKAHMRYTIWKQMISRNFPVIAAGCILFAIALLPPAPPQNLEITAIDVGQGDGFLIRQGDFTMIIDGGSTSQKKLGEKILTPGLEARGIDHIDTWLITHCDQDHMNGLSQILSENADITVSTLFLSPAADGDERYDDLRVLADTRDIAVQYFGTGDRMEVSRLTMTGLYPGPGYREEPNSHSIGMLLEYGDFSMLFTGDMGKEEEAEMLQYMTSQNILPEGLDILKAGHHGSSTSTSEELLDTLQPEYAILSYGQNNRYGHPHQETVRALTDRGIELLETAKVGQIKILTDGKKTEIEKFR